jgi:uncharacterized peroxidase-related enzyme
LAQKFLYVFATDVAEKTMKDRQARIKQVEPQPATGKIGQLFADVQAKFDMVPNIFRMLAKAPAAFEGLMNLSAALAGGTLDKKTREQLGLAIAESNLCDYCLSAHRYLGARAGLTPAEIDDAIRASAAHPKTDALLKLARGMIVQRGELTDANLKRARAAGLTDGEIIETVANVALNIFENYLCHVTRVPIDFPQNKSRDESSQGGESSGER